MTNQQQEDRLEKADKRMLPWEGWDGKLRRRSVHENVMLIISLCGDAEHQHHPYEWSYWSQNGGCIYRIKHRGWTKTLQSAKLNAEATAIIEGWEMQEPTGDTPSEAPPVLRASDLRYRVEKVMLADKVNAQAEEMESGVQRDALLFYAKHLLRLAIRGGHFPVVDARDEAESFFSDY